MFLLGIWMILNYTGATYAAQTGTVTTSGSSLNIREKASTSATVVASAPNHATVNVLSTSVGESDGYSWYKVSYNGTEGYAVSQYIKLNTDTSTSQATQAPAETLVPTKITRTKVTYKKISVPGKIRTATSLYKEPNQKSLLTLAKKKSVTVTGEKTVNGVKWFKVKVVNKKKTQKGYVEAIKVHLKMTAKKTAYGTVTGVKSSLKVRKKWGKKTYVKVDKKKVTIPKGTQVQIKAEKKIKKKVWYKIAFSVNKKNYTGYVINPYIKLCKQAVTSVVTVTALTSAQFETHMKNQGFPESYKPALRKLHASYPYWTFQALKTGLNWSDVIDKESVVGVNLISNSKSAPWKSTDPAAYDSTTGKWKVFDGSSWVAVSREAVEYYMDPRNFLTVQTVYMFESLDYQKDYQTATGVEQILNNTPFANQSFTYDNNGTTATMKYSKAFMEAARLSSVSPYHLASRVKQEVVTSATTTSSAVSGTHSTYPGIYNFYNIGATNGDNPVARGLKWASEGTTYLRPWTDPYRSIVGGGQYIGATYINKGQNTVYLEKFNVTSTNTYNHQYMANIEAASTEALKTKNAYNGMLDTVPLVFSIPVYENMPEEACQAPK